MTGKIFISYRRGDDPGFTTALYQRLEDEFSAANLFMDVEGHIKPGDDFVDVLADQVAKADVLLAVIGPRWQDLLTARAADPDDFVAVEIKAALEQGKCVVPVLVGGASMPRADEMPEGIRSLARRNAVGLRPERFRADCQGLVTSLKEQLMAAESARAARSQAERKVAEKARQEAEDQAAARVIEAERRTREQERAGLTPAEIRKAEELANWQFVEKRGVVSDVRDHLARFPGGVTERYGLIKLDELVWAWLGDKPGQAALQAYLDEFPNAVHGFQARASLAKFEKAATAAKANDELKRKMVEAWDAALSINSHDGFRSFMKAWPKSEHRSAARASMAALGGTKSNKSRWWIGIGLAVIALGIAGQLMTPKRYTAPTGYIDTTNAPMETGTQQSYSATARCSQTGAIGIAASEPSAGAALAAAVADCIDRGGVPACCQNGAQLR